MKRNMCVVCGVCLGALLVAFAVAGCSAKVSEKRTPAVIVERPGPPPHAKAYGYRAKHAYLYYPSTYVYFDIERRVYFYLENGHWGVGVSLPASITISAGEAVTLELETDTPYIHFEEHKAKYPPGQLKKSGPKPGKGR